MLRYSFTSDGSPPAPLVLNGARTVPGPEAKIDPAVAEGFVSQIFAPVLTVVSSCCFAPATACNPPLVVSVMANCDKAALIVAHQPNHFVAVFAQSNAA